MALDATSRTHDYLGAAYLDPAFEFELGVGHVKYTYLDGLAWSNTADLASLLNFEVAGCNGGWDFIQENRRDTPSSLRPDNKTNMINIILNAVAGNGQGILFYWPQKSLPLFFVDWGTSEDLSSGVECADSYFYCYHMKFSLTNWVIE